MTSFIIHIGDGKCGSSSIQAALHKSAETLERNGILYSSSTPKNGHFNLIRLIGGKTRGDDILTLQQATESISLMQRELSDKYTVLLSAESFFDKAPEDIYTILKNISGHVEHIHIVAYVRPPHSMYLSLIQQQLKGNSTFDKPHLYCRPLDRLLGAWKVFDKTSSITVRSFEKSSLLNGDVVSDFSQVLRKITGKKIDLPPNKENVSLTAEQMYTLQVLRRKVLSAYDGKLHPYSGSLISYFEQLNILSQVGTKPQLSRSALKAVLKNNHGVVQNLNVIFPELKLSFPSGKGEESLLQRLKIMTNLVCGGARFGKSSDDISAVLEKVDSELAGQLCCLVPQLNPGLAMGVERQQKEALLRIVSEFEIDKDSLVRLTRDYWGKWGMRNSASQLDALFT